MEISAEMILGIAGLITAIGTAWLTIQKIAKSNKRDKEAEKAEILQEAKEHVAQVRKDLEFKIDELESKLEHLREIYSGEIKNLGQKIEDLRSELRNQHGQLVQLLTKMIDHKD